MNPRFILYLMLVVAVLNGLIWGAYDAFQIPANDLYYLLYSIVCSLQILLWYYVDSQARGYYRVWPLSLAILVIPYFAIPWYLFCSRPPGRRLRALAALVGFCLLWALCNLLAGLPFLLLGET